MIRGVVGGGDGIGGVGIPGSSGGSAISTARRTRSSSGAWHSYSGRARRAHRAAKAVAEGTADRAVVVDGAGIGSAITANKVPGIRAAKCDSIFDVVNSRAHNDANVLTLGARLERNAALDMVKTWLETEFEGGRHARRVDKIVEIERSYLK